MNTSKDQMLCSGDLIKDQMLCSGDLIKDQILCSLDIQYGIYADYCEYPGCKMIVIYNDDDSCSQVCSQCGYLAYCSEHLNHSHCGDCGLVGSLIGEGSIGSGFIGSGSIHGYNCKRCDVFLCEQCVQENRKLICNDCK